MSKFRRFFEKNPRDQLAALDIQHNDLMHMHSMIDFLLDQYDYLHSCIMRQRGISPLNDDAASVVDHSREVDNALCALKKDLDRYHKCHSALYQEVIEKARLTAAMNGETNE
jgi:hypothetical protein